MSNGWTPERRARQAARIKMWKPWQQATGPVTEEGKAHVSRNGYKGGSWRKLWDGIKKMYALLREQNLSAPSGCTTCRS